MKITFPEHFFGTSTAAYQIETAFEHDWQGFKARDGYTFDRTTDHELRRKEDTQIIASLAPNYRMSLVWSKLQRERLRQLSPETAQEYHEFISRPRERGCAHHDVCSHHTPLWFAKRGGWGP